MVNQPMTEAKAIIASVVGVAFIILAFTVKQFYYARGVFGVTSGRPAPRLFGRVLFSVVGAGFLLVAITYLLSSH